MRSILLATDGSQHALRSAYYLADLYKGASDVHVTVLNVSSAIPPLYREEAHDPAIRQQFTSWQKRREKEAKEHIGEAVKVLQRGGLKKNRVTAKYRQQSIGIARDIIHEMNAGEFDACVVGKKGMGWFASTLFGSITGKLLEVSEDRPLWLIEGKKWNSRKVLIAMDETRSAVDMARYAGTMLQGVEGVEILFYHFCTPFTEDLSSEERKRLKELEKRVVEREKEELVHYYEESKQVLFDLGFPEKSLKFEFRYHRSARPKKVSQAILEKVQKDGFGTLVIGRKGATEAREFRIGSVAMRTAAEASDCAVWVV